MSLSRRCVLRGLGGAVLGLPWLESLGGRQAHAQQAGPAPYAIFFRQANGVAARQDTGEIGSEPERFWPRTPGELTGENLAGRALAELSGYAERLLVVGNMNMENFPYNDGHARGALQLLTAQGPTVARQGGDSEAAGESLDHRIGRELNVDGRESLFLYAGATSGWLGGPCISYRGAGRRRSALVQPASAYQALTGGPSGASESAEQQRSLRQASINDRVRTELQSLLASPRLSGGDRQRLDLHLSSVRDVEVSLSCRLEESAERALAGAPQSSTDGDVVLANARLHMDIAAIAVACGWTRSVAIQVGDGNDGNTRYRDVDTGQLMEGNFHFVSHRRLSHNSDGAIISDSDRLHHKVDVQFAQTFRYLLDRLDQYQFPAGSLLDAGMAVWVNDLGNGPAHSNRGCPCIVAGSAGGFLRQGQYVRLSGGDGSAVNHARVLNTLGSAAGLRGAKGQPIEDFGSAELDRRVLSELMA